MLWATYDAITYIELIISKSVTAPLRHAAFIWHGVWVEWLALQTFILYTLYKLYTTANYLRQVLCLMVFVVGSCLYLSLWQLELFSCFLFLGEFTIFIFVYCLLLHLRASVTVSPAETTGGTVPVHLIVGALVVTLWVRSSFLSNAYEIGALFIDTYRISSDFIMNDLASLYYFFVTSNLLIHFLIGVILLGLTIFLFSVVTAYTVGLATRNAALRTPAMRLNVSKGYYEQQAYDSQKHFGSK